MYACRTAIYDNDRNKVITLLAICTRLITLLPCGALARMRLLPPVIYGSRTCRNRQHNLLHQNGPGIGAAGSVSGTEIFNSMRVRQQAKDCVRSEIVVFPRTCAHAYYLQAGSSILIVCDHQLTANARELMYFVN